MVAEALDRLGRGDAIAQWTDRYVQLLRPRPRAEAPISPRTWHAALGDWTRAGDWLRFFEAELCERDWHDVVRTWLPRLMTGPDMLGHGPIRLFHVLRGLSDDVTSVRLQELSDALAYWAMAYDREFQFSRGSAGSPDPVTERVFDDLILQGAWAYAARPDFRPIVLTHAVTAPRAFRELLPWLSEDDCCVALDVAVALSEQIRAPYLAPPPVIGDGQREAGRLIDQACLSGDDHAIKLTEACLEQFERQPETVYLVIADDISRRLSLNV
jgi:hypothetical protein